MTFTSLSKNQNLNNINNIYDVAICGGGLAGLTLARQLKQNLPELSIIIIDRLCRPLPESAIKVGESTVELGSYYLSEVLDLSDYFQQYHLPKLGLRFFLGDAQKPFQHRPELGLSQYHAPSSYQIDRGKLENDLRQFNLESGIELRENCKVQAIELTHDATLKHRIIYSHSDTKETKVIEADWVIDAMGRRRFLQKQLGLEKPNNTQYNAVWFWVEGRLDISDFVPPTENKWHARVPDSQRYYSTNHLCGKGYWIWIIPLPSNHTSIGIVTDGDLHPFGEHNTYQRALQWLEKNEPILASHLKRYVPQKFMKMPKYSYSSEQLFSGNRWACVGESAVFPDPFYSPGTDLIGFGNSLVTQMIKSDRQGKLTPEMVNYANQFVLTYSEGVKGNIHNVYDCFDNELILALKVIWDTLVGWAFNTPVMFNNLFLDQEKYSQVLKISSRFSLLGHRMQQLFRDWSLLSQRRGTFEFIDYLEIEFIKKLRTRNLQTGKTISQLRNDYATNLEIFEELSQVIFLIALEDTMPEELGRFSSKPWLNAWGISLKKEQWQTDRLFQPSSPPRDLSQMEAQLRQRINFKPYVWENYDQQHQPAISHGESLPEDINTAKTLVEALQQTVQKHPQNTIVYIHSHDSAIEQSYLNLLEEAQIILSGLRKLGLQPEDKVILQLELNQDFIPAFWACILGGFIPVPLAISSSYHEDSSNVSKLISSWEMLSKPLIVSSTNLFYDLDLLATKLSLKNWKLSKIDDLRQHQPDSNFHTTQPDDVALLLLTSGSTGKPKAVQLTHNNILSRARGRAQKFGFSHQDVSFNWFSLDHVASLVMFHLRDVYLGCQQIHAPTQLILENPLRWLDGIAKYQATVTWAPNFAYGLVNDHANQITKGYWDLSSMQCIFNGGEAIDGQTAKTFLDLLKPHQLPNNALYPDWGMTEISSGIVYADSFTEDKENQTFVNLGKPIPGTSLRIVNHANQLLRESQIGKVQVKGTTVMKGYYQNEELNQEVFTVDGWFNTGDLGFLQEGKLTLTGRAKDVIIINGINYANHEIEAAVEELSGVRTSYTAAFAVTPPDCQTESLAIFFSPKITDEEELHQQIKQIRTKIVQAFGIKPDYILPVSPETIPKTSIGKIKRAQLRQRLEAGEFDLQLAKFASKTNADRELKGVVPETEMESNIAQIWQEVLNLTSVSMEDNFFELGGHSLLVAQLISRINQVLEVELSPQILFEKPTIARLSQYLEIVSWSTKEEENSESESTNEYVEGLI